MGGTGVLVGRMEARDHKKGGHVLKLRTRVTLRDGTTGVVIERSRSATGRVRVRVLVDNQRRGCLRVRRVIESSAKEG